MTTIPTRRKRLIEVAFPLEEVSADSRKDPYRGSPHPQTLHRWWARRPLAACRAFIYASLVDDPDTEPEREALLKEVADLASWDAVRHPEKVVRGKADGGSGLTGTELLKRARRRILDCNGGRAPKLLDPFAGGGAIPLEGLRLGCEAEASDLNPVAVLILKGTLEYPQKYGQSDSRPTPEYIRQAARERSQSRFTDDDLLEAYRRNPLVTDVRYWGGWMLERAREELAEFYPPDPDGSVPVAYLWSRTIPCPNCAAEMPLIRQYWLARKDKKRVALEPVLDRTNNRVDFQVVEGQYVSGDPAEATTSRGDTKCLLCGQVVKAAQVRQAGIEGSMSAALTAVVLAAGDRQGKTYRGDVAEDALVYTAATEQLDAVTASHKDDLPLVPGEPTPRHLTGGVITAFGFDTFGKLFNSRQLLAMTTFARLVGEAHARMLRSGVDAEYARAVATYLGLATSRLTSEHCSLTRWNPAGQKGQGALGLQALPMVWDFAELNPWGGTVGDASTAIDLVSSVIGFSCDAPFVSRAHVVLRDARHGSDHNFSAVITDPPYYDAINYADLSDFYYVWFKRSLGFLHPDLFSMPLSPKREQVVMNVYSTHGDRERRPGKEQARELYVDGMAQSFQSMAASLEPTGVQGVVFAHTDPDAWATLIEGLLAARLVPDASWPIDTEMGTKVSTSNQARLKTSVWMACRKREEKAGEAFLGDVMDEMRPVIRERLLYFWGKGHPGRRLFHQRHRPRPVGLRAPPPRPAARWRRGLGPRPPRYRAPRVHHRCAGAGAARRGPRRGRSHHPPVRHLGVELLARAPRLRRGHRPLPGHRRGLRRHDAPSLHRRPGAGEEQEGSAAADRPTAGDGGRRLGPRQPRSPGAPHRSAPTRSLALGTESCRCLGNIQRLTGRDSLGSHAHPGPSCGRMPPGRRRGSPDHQWPAGQQRHGHRATGVGHTAPAPARPLGGTG